MDANPQQNMAQEGLEGVKTEIRVLGDRFTQLDRSLGHVISTSRIGYGFIATLLSLAIIMGGFLGAGVYNLSERISAVHMRIIQENTSLDRVVTSLAKSVDDAEQQVEEMTSSLNNVLNVNAKLIEEIDDLRERVHNLESVISK
jgi:hypothetical protein